MAEAQMTQIKMTDLRVYLFSDRGKPTSKGKRAQFELAAGDALGPRPPDHNVVQCNCACK